jgi:hypothetical protein
MKNKCVSCGRKSTGHSRDEQPLCNECGHGLEKSKKKVQKRKLLEVSISRAGVGEASRFFASSRLPMSDADARASETCAGMAIQPINAQLDFSGSQYRLSMYDTKTGKRVVMTEGE